MFDGMTFVIVLIVAAVAYFIVRTVRRTIRAMDARDSDADSRLAARLQGRDVLCERCGAQSSLLFGSDSLYKCDTCSHVFAGLPHLPADAD